MLRAIRRFALFGILTASTLACAGSQVSVPDWVQQAAAQPDGIYPAETKAVVLLDETTYSVTSASEYIENHRRVVRILRPDGRDEGEFAVQVSKQDKVISLHAWSIDKAGTKFELKQKEFAERIPYSYELFNDIRYYVGMAPASLQGSVVAFESQTKRHAWRTSDHWYAQEQVPVKLAVFNLELPAGWEYSAKWANREPVEPETAGPGRITWILRDLPAIADDEHRPPYLAVAQSMALAYFPPGSNRVGTWEEIAQWSRQLASDRRVANPAITEKVRELTSGTSDFDSKARTLTSFVQREVRYVLISIGIGGWQPHPAADIFRARYGDCKDKATVLSTMLKEAGINSELALVYTDHGVTQPNVPGNMFNHMILGIELPDGVPSDKYRSVVKTSAGKLFLIFDPTDTYTQLGFIRNELQGNYVLMQSPNGGELLQIPKLDPDTNMLVRTAKLKLGVDGTLSGQVSEQRSGDHAHDLRLRFEGLTEKERVQWLERQASRSLKQFTLGEPVFENIGAFDKDVFVKYDLTTQNYGQASDPLLLVRNRVLGPVSFRLPNKARSYAVELGDITHIRDVVEIELPPGHVVDDMPFPVKLDVEFASYQSQYEKSANMVRYTRDYVVRDPHVPLDKLTSLKKLESIIGQDEFASTVLKKVP